MSNDTKSLIVDAIISLLEKVNQVLDSGKVLVGVFLNLKTKFYTIDHKILVDKLFRYGIRGTFLIGSKII